MEGITGSPWFPTLFGYGRGVLGAVGEVDGDNSVILEALTSMDRQRWSAPECNVKQAPRILLYSSESTPQLRNTSTGKSAGGQPGPVEKLIPGYPTRLRCRVEPIVFAPQSPAWQRGATPRMPGSPQSGVGSCRSSGVRLCSGATAAVAGALLLSTTSRRVSRRPWACICRGISFVHAPQHGRHSGRGHANRSYIRRRESVTNS